MPGYDLHTHLAPDIPGAARLGIPSLYCPDELIAYLDRVGLDHAVVSVPPPLYRQHLDDADAAVRVHALNRGIRRVTAVNDRLLPLAYLPLEHPRLAVAEYRRIREERGWFGLTAAAGGRSVSLADPLLDPLWRHLDGDERMLVLHPGSTVDSRLDEFYLANLLGNPVETALAAAQLVFGDVLRRYPRMRVVLLHCGGAMPALAGRWQRGADTARPGLDAGAEPPARAVRRFYVDCLAHHPGAVDLAADVVGADRIVLGSDWPFPMGVDDPRTLVAHRGSAYVQQVAVDNAVAVLESPLRGELRSGAAGA